MTIEKYHSRTPAETKICGWLHPGWGHFTSARCSEVGKGQSSGPRVFPQLRTPPTCDPEITSGCILEAFCGVRKHLHMPNSWKKRAYSIYVSCFQQSDGTVADANTPCNGKNGFPIDTAKESFALLSKYFNNMFIASNPHTFLAYNILEESNESSTGLQSTITSVSYNT